MNLHDVVEIVMVLVTALFAFLGLRFSLHAAQGRVALLEATAKLSTSFDEKFEKLSAEIVRLRIELDRESMSARALNIDRRLLQSERDHHWVRNMFENLLAELLDMDKRDEIIARVNRHIESRWKRDEP